MDTETLGMDSKDSLRAKARVCQESRAPGRIVRKLARSGGRHGCSRGYAHDTLLQAMMQGESRTTYGLPGPVMMRSPARSRRTEVHKQNLVFAMVDDFRKLRAERHQIGSRQPAFENGELKVDRPTRASL